jgi:hypothetical protein
MRGALSIAAVACVLAGCGYPGEPLPPALNRPMRITDLLAVERGGQIDVRFTVPKTTTEALDLKSPPDIELRIGEMAEAAAWEHTSERIAGLQIEKNLAAVSIPAQKYYGKTVMIGVKARGPQGRDDGWSNFEIFPVIPALRQPEGLTPKDAPDAVQLDWRGQAPEYRIFREAPGEKTFSLSGTVPRPSYSDPAIEFGKSYQYYVVAVEKTGDRYAESLPSDSVTFAPTDRFPPAAPAGLTAVPGTQTIELVWDRGGERDLASYRVYRNGQLLAGDIAAPAYSDRAAQPGTEYRYHVTAVDTAGNESSPSPDVTAAIP